MTVTEPMDGVRRRKPIGLALTLMIGPYAAAAFFLIVGLFGSLGWVYLSIALSVLGLPFFAVGVYLLARRSAAAAPSPASRWRFNSPPGWPEPPEGWTPPPGWQPDPSWPAAPADWQWWAAADRG